METKAYFASSIPAAIEVARRELGPEALLVGSRPAPLQARKFGRVEVTFAWSPPVIPSEEDTRHVLPMAIARSGQSIVRHPADEEFEDIRRQLRAVRSALGPNTAQPAVREWTERLVEMGLERQIAEEVTSDSKQPQSDPQLELPGILAQRIKVAPFVPLKSSESRILAFIGPPGRGKSTTLIKVAVAKALASRTPVRIYTAGAHGVGKSEQMERYCSILGAPHQGVESLESLALILQGEAWKGMTLIDTPGLSPSETQEVTAFSRFFQRHTNIETHLVLRADSRYVDMLTVIERFAELRPGRLLFVGIDETNDWSAMINALVRTSTPVTFEGNGPRIPEDLAEPDAMRLYRCLVARLPRESGSGAGRALAA